MNGGEALAITIAVCVIAFVMVLELFIGHLPHRP